MPARQASSESERVAEADGELCDAGLEPGVGNEARLAERNEELVPRLVFPAIARGEAEAAADVVELRLQQQLHVGGEIDHAVQRQDVDVDIAGGQIDEGGHI